MADQEPGRMELSEGEAADAMALAGLFRDETEPTPERKMPPKDPATGKFVKQKSEDSESEETSEKTEVEEETEPDEAEAPAGETTEEKEVRLLKLKLDGMEQEVPEEEVVKGYLRQSDYTRKTQELAEARKKFEAEELPAVRQEREYYAQNLERLAEALEALAPSREPDWAEYSKRMTPEEFTTHYQQWKANRDRVEKVNAEHARVQALHEQETLRERATRLKAEQELLEAAIPELKDPEKGKVLREDLSMYAKSVYRFTDDDLSNIEDHRALVILEKARRWDESQKRRPKVEEKVERAIAGLKPSGATSRPKAKEAAQAKARAAQTGREDDVVEAMRAAKLFG